ncbi:MAG TPA: Spy/CpxP family protein refolding chaperone [Nitrospirota bacterium]|nr:Spy/CpxP family protein refolding chaperone [Nitrospirota bacterium]
MKKMMIVVVTGLMFLGLASQRSYADPCGCGGMGMPGGSQMMHHGPGFRNGSHGGGHFLWKKLMGLGLSDQQIDTLKEIKTRVTKDTIKKRADLQLARVDLRELLRKDPVDMKAVEASLKKIESASTDLKLSHIKAREEMKAVLTPEQRKKLKEEIKAGFKMHQGRYGHAEDSSPVVAKDEAQSGTDAE